MIKWSMTIPRWNQMVSSCDILYIYSEDFTVRLWYEYFHRL